MLKRSAVVAVLAFALLAMAMAGVARAQGVCAPGSRGECDTADAGVEQTAPDAAPRPPGQRAVHLVFFWGVGCPHCEEAMPFVARLESAEGVAVERIEVRRSDEGRARLSAEVDRLRIDAPGIPLFVVGDRWALGYRGRATEDEVMRLVREARGPRAPPPPAAPPPRRGGGRGGGRAPRRPAPPAGARPAGPRAPGGRRGAPGARPPGPLPRRAAPPTVVVLPIVGAVDAAAVPLPWLTLLVGLLDGLNPCAFYVLVVLLGILLHVRSRARIALFGGAFVVMSGLVYFLFMTAWLNAFLFLGLSRSLTRALGVLLVAMALVNLKEIAWFKRGVSLMIPEKAKPGLFRRMRGVARAASVPTALVGIVALAFVVNLIELGCTLGLPAIYTRVLSLRTDLGDAARYAYLALYNVAYVVPLAAIVAVFAVTMNRLKMTERHAKILKAVSGVLLLAFGLLFAIAPEVLG